MPNGLAIMTANGIKEFPLPAMYGLEQGRLRFELKKLDVIFLQSLGDGKGLKIENIGPLGEFSIIPHSCERIQVVAVIGKNSFSLSFRDKCSSFSLSSTEQQNRSQLDQLPAFLEKALGNKVQINFV